MVCGEMLALKLRSLSILPVLALSMEFKVYRAYLVIRIPDTVVTIEYLVIL